MGIFYLISNIFGAVKEFFGFQNKRLDLKNTQEMKNADAAQKEQDNKDAINKAIQEKNEDEIRKGIS
jgi:hypothetical protein